MKAGYKQPTFTSSLKSAAPLNIRQKLTEISEEVGVRILLLERTQEL
jgi:hypothetical protein